MRQYADALGLDANQVDEALAAMQVDAPPLPSPMPHPDKSMLRDIRPMVSRGFRPPMRVLPSLGFLVLVVVGCSVLYSWWHRIEGNAQASETGRNDAGAKPKQAQVPIVETRSVTPQVSAPAAPAQTDAAHPDSAQPGTAQPGTGEQAAAPASDAADGVRITLAATEDTWVSVSADGHSVFAGVIKGQQSRSIAGKENTRVRLGNAGGVQIEWNGRPLGSLGKKGEVRDVLFTRDSYKLIEKPPPSDDDKPEATT